MPVTVVIGAQWGDEGKGKITDLLAKEMDVAVRFSGGDNAGHTVINPQGDFKLHLVPAGIFNPNTICIIGNGVAVNPKTLVGEIDALEQKSISCRNLKISNKAHLIMPWHMILDGLQEEERGQGKIGTTKKGMGPVFSDKVARFGFRVEDLFSQNMEEKLARLRKRVVIYLLQIYYYNSYDLAYDKILKDLLDFKSRISPFVAETEPILWNACCEKKRILMEGAQGVLLDPDFGTYPETTSSSCTVNSAMQGSGISWNYITEVVGVVKAYTTRVCEKNHPFPSEMPEEIANPFRERTGEFGATTGRPRRIGWLDTCLVRYSAMLNGFTGLAVTRLDSLTGFEKLRIYYGYRSGLKNISISCLNDFSISKLGSYEPLYYEVPGWNNFPKNPKCLSDLPKEAQSYLLRMEIDIGVPIKIVSVGPERDQVIVR